MLGNMDHVFVGLVSGGEGSYKWSLLPWVAARRKTSTFNNLRGDRLCGLVMHAQEKQGIGDPPPHPL